MTPGEWRRSEFAEELRRLRKAKNWTLKELSQQIKVTEGYLSKLEKDNISPPSDETLKKIVEGLDGDYEKIKHYAHQIGRLSIEKLQHQADTRQGAARLTGPLLNAIADNGLSEMQATIMYNFVVNELTDEQIKAIQEIIERP